MKRNDIQFLAYYLPQFHPISENDKWWGKGFTEWTNVKKAKPLFRGHKQPVIPGELGYYDLMKSVGIQEKQAVLAKNNGVDGFIYYQYWFDTGKLLLEKPAEKMLANKSVNIPFCFCWANETWKGIWHGLDNPEVLIEQKYDGVEGYTAYFNYLLPFFKDNRYIMVDNKPMFHIYRVEDIPDFDIFTNVFNQLAIKAGFDGVYIVSTIVSNLEKIIGNDAISGQIGMDTFVKMRYSQPQIFSLNSILGRLERKIKSKYRGSQTVGVREKPLVFDYAKGVSKFNIKFPHSKYISCVFPNWDNSPRSGNKSLIFKKSNPIAWEKHLKVAVNELKKNPNNPQFIIIKSWNEWAEGNYLEPDKIYGSKWLEAIKKVKNDILK